MELSWFLLIFAGYQVFRNPKAPNPKTPNPKNHLMTILYYTVMKANLVVEIYWNLLNGFQLAVYDPPVESILIY